jgi:hypothetical protein
MDRATTEGTDDGDDRLIDDLDFQESLAVDAADAFIQQLQSPAEHSDPGMSAPITSGDHQHDPGTSTSLDHSHDSAADAGMSTGGPHGPDPAASFSHDADPAAHDQASLGGHEQGVPPYFDPGSVHH